MCQLNHIGDEGSRHCLLDDILCFDFLADQINCYISFLKHFFVEFEAPFVAFVSRFLFFFVDLG